MWSYLSNQPCFELHLLCLIYRYIRVYGVHNTVNKVFHLVHFECSYSNTSYELGQDGVIGKF